MINIMEWGKAETAGMIVLRTAVTGITFCIFRGGSVPFEDEDAEGV